MDVGGEMKGGGGEHGGDDRDSLLLPPPPLSRGAGDRHPVVIGEGSSVLDNAQVVASSTSGATLGAVRALTRARRRECLGHQRAP